MCGYGGRFVLPQVARHPLKPVERGARWEGSDRH